MFRGAREITVFELLKMLTERGVDVSIGSCTAYVDLSSVDVAEMDAITRFYYSRFTKKDCPTEDLGDE